MKLILSILFIALIGNTALYAQDPDDESTQYVKVASSNPDAVVQDGTDFFESESICTLLQNQAVTVLDSTDGEYVMIRFKCKGKTVEGWVKKVILTRKPIQNVARISDGGAVDSAHYAAPGTVMPGLPDMDPDIEAKGTGRTTGHIANLVVTNNDSVPIVTVAQTVYIPSGGQYQPYIARIPEGTIIPPDGTVTIPLSGYCADAHVPPVSNGADFPSPGDNWIPVGVAGVPLGGGTSVPIELINTDPVPTFTPGDIPAITSTPAFTPSNKPTGDIVITWPGTGTPVGGTLNPESNPRHYAQVIVEVLERLEDAVVIIQEDEQYNTPFSSDPGRERDAILQHDLWRYTGAITGNPYEEEDFAANVYDQFETSTGKPVASLPPDQQRVIDIGIADFWNTFQATGVEAKVIRSNGTTEAQIFPGLEKDKVKDDLKKQGGQAEGQGNPQAPGTDSPTPGATVREEKEEKAECKCESMTFTVATNFGGLQVNSSNEEVYEFTANKSSPKKVVVEVDEDDFSQKMTIIVSDIKVTCNCDDAQCEYYSGKPSADTKGKVTISDVKATGANAPKDGRTISGNGISVDATAKKTSANYYITFKVSATCTLDDCGEDVCIRYISIEIKPRKK